MKNKNVTSSHKAMEKPSELGNKEFTNNKVIEKLDSHSDIWDEVMIVVEYWATAQKESMED